MFDPMVNPMVKGSSDGSGVGSPVGSGGPRHGRPVRSESVDSAIERFLSTPDKVDAQHLRLRSASAFSGTEVRGTEERGDADDYDHVDDDVMSEMQAAHETLVASGSREFHLRHTLAYWVIEVSHNDGFTNFRPRKLAFWTAWSDLSGSLLFLAGSVAGFFGDEVLVNWCFIVGCILFLGASLCGLWMWKMEQVRLRRI
jgi:hypothetical protein